MESGLPAIKTTRFCTQLLLTPGSIRPLSTSSTRKASKYSHAFKTEIKCFLSFSALISAILDRTFKKPKMILSPLNTLI